MAAATPLMTSAGEPETSPSILANLKVPVVIVSPTLATPRAIPASLQNGLTPMTSSSAPARVPQMPGASTTPAKQEEGNGSGDSRSSSSGHQEEETNDRHEEHPSIADPEEIDGRATPLASESSRMSHSGSNGPADQSQSNHSISPPIPPPASYTNGSGISSLPQAEIGLSTLVTEQQLKETAKGKDRMFLLLLSREIESFVARSDQAATNGTSSPAHTSMAVTTATTSKYQKMLVYKMAEWYGLRGLSGPDGTIHITAVGTLEPKSTTLRFADIAPKPPSPKQNFRIMQRVPLGSDGTNGSRAGSVVGDDGLEVGTSKRKTLEEREAEYALARERIYGSSDEPTEPSATLAGSEKANIASTAVGATNPSGEGESSTQPVYASLQRSVHSNTSQQPPSHDRPYAQNPYADPTYLAEQNALVYGYGAVPGDFAGSDPSGSNGMHYNGHGAYPQNPEMGYPSPSAGYGQYAHWQGQAGYPGPQPGQQMMPGAWGYPNPPTMPPGHAGQPMPMIPQGAPAFPYQQYGYPQMQPPTYPQGNGYGMYGHLAQPTPTRPAAVPHTHSSTSSSISSRSYQDFSRPHSRGSTTSNRSAASSVRLGAMYPAGGSGPGYRQKGMKGPTFSGMSSMGGNDRRQSRGHSPSSATTTSSKSSRRASIQLQPPQAGQHQLPRKPDWAANNISYHPSPIPPQPQPGAHGPSTSDFPPLLRQNNGTDAVPMQMERAKLMGVNVSATAWNGNATIRGPQGHLHLGHIMQPGALPPSPALSTTNGSYAIPDYNGGPQGYPMHPRAQGYNPQPIISPGPSQTPVPRQVDGEDPDFPRRVITTKTAASLYDPSAESASARPTSATEPIPTSARAVSAAAVNVDGLSPEEAIEAKLAALSVSAGISIGPAPNKQVASYAKIVRRD